MAVVNLQPPRGDRVSGDFQLLETDTYRMKIADIKLEENQFAEANTDGSRPTQIVIRWEVTAATDEQDEDCIGNATWQRFAPYYGDVRAGGPSKFKAFIDSLDEQDLLPEFDPLAFDLDILLGVEQKVSVEKYTKQQGKNAGQQGNKVTMVAPLKKSKKAAKPVKAGVEDADLPF